MARPRKMAKNTIVAVMLAVNVIVLLIMTIIGKIDGDTFAASVTGLTAVATTLIGIFSVDTKKPNNDNQV